jgi:creatinine amidohydrolase
VIYDWTTLTSPELGELARQDALAVLALGAVEQHGPHLPLGTDLMIADGLMAAVRDRLAPVRPVLVLPSLALGASEEHDHFGGTLSLSSTHAAATIRALGERVHAAGVERLVLLNAHGGNHAVMTAAALDLRRRLGMLVVKASYLRLDPPPSVLAADELRHGLHGGQAETAMMLALAPDQVRMDRARAFESIAERSGDSLLGPEGPASWAWMAEDLNPAGVVGRADRATPEQGRILIDHYASLMAGIITEAAAMPMPWKS